LQLVLGGGGAVVVAGPSGHPASGIRPGGMGWDSGAIQIRVS